jgi:hypothetical protein
MATNDSTKPKASTQLIEVISEVQVNQTRILAQPLPAVPGSNARSGISHVNGNTLNNRVQFLSESVMSSSAQNRTEPPYSDDVPFTTDPQAYDTVADVEPTLVQGSPEPAYQTLTPLVPTGVVSRVSNRSHTESEVPKSPRSEKFSPEPVPKMATWSAGDQQKEQDSPTSWTRLQAVSRWIQLSIEVFLSVV